MRSYSQMREWPPLAVAAWLLALIVGVTLLVLAATDVVGPWAVVVTSVMSMTVGLVGYREQSRAKRNAGDRA